MGRRVSANVMIPFSTAYLLRPAHSLQQFYARREQFGKRAAFCPGAGPSTDLGRAASPLLPRRIRFALPRMGKKLVAQNNRYGFAGTRFADCEDVGKAVPRDVRT